MLTNANAAFGKKVKSHAIGAHHDGPDRPGLGSLSRKSSQNL